MRFRRCSLVNTVDGLTQICTGRLLRCSPRSHLWCYQAPTYILHRLHMRWCRCLLAHVVSFLDMTLYIHPTLIRMIRGAALWTAVIAKDAWLGNVKVQHGYKLGIYVTAGPSICMSLSCLFAVRAC